MERLKPDRDESMIGCWVRCENLSVYSGSRTGMRSVIHNDNMLRDITGNFHGLLALRCACLGPRRERLGHVVARRAHPSLWGIVDINVSRACVRALLEPSSTLTEQIGHQSQQKQASSPSRSFAPQGLPSSLMTCMYLCKPT